jgi:hypothetical protein
MRVPERNTRDRKRDAHDQRDDLDEALAPSFLLRRAASDPSRIFFGA